MSHDTDAGGRSALAVAATAVLVVSAVAAGVSLTAVGTVSAAPTTVDECTTIDEPGTYELSADLSVRGEACLSVEASDVTLEGNGHRITRTAPDSLPDPDSDYREPAPVRVGGSEPVTNVTVRNLTVSVDTIGTLFGPEESADAVTYRNASDSVLSNVTASGATGVWPHVRVAGTNNTVEGVPLDTGVFTIRGDDNRLVDSTARGGDDLWYPIRVLGDRTVVENVTSYGKPALLTSGNDTVVRNSTLTSAFNFHAMRVEDSRNALVVNNTIPERSYAGLRLENTSSSRVASNSFDRGISLRHSDGNEIENNDRGRISLANSDDNTVSGNTFAGRVSLRGSSESNLVYDNRIVADGAPVVLGAGPDGETPGPNAWNVSLRAGENVVGGDTVGGNYYANDDGTGFSQQCEDADGDGICDSPYEIDGNNTDYHPLADPADDGTEPGYYQVDFVGGQPIENLSADRLYAGEDRLLRFAFGNSEEGITHKDSAWPNETLRECVDYGHIGERDDGTAAVTFTVAEGCSDVTLSLAVYSMPGETFDVDTVDQQELLNASTDSYGPGEHTVAVALPDGSETDPDETADGSTTPAVDRPSAGE